MVSDDELAQWPGMERPRYNFHALTIPVLVAPCTNPLPGALGFHKCDSCGELMQFTAISGISAEAYYKRKPKPRCPECGHELLS